MVGVVCLSVMSEEDWAELLKIWFFISFVIRWLILRIMD